MNPRFIADSMLGNIARKLRIIGYDTEFLPNSDDDYLIERGVSSNRIILTKDKQLYFRLAKKNAKRLLLSSNDDEFENLIFILNKLNIYHVSSIPNKSTRCTACNGNLTVFDKSSERDSIPEKVYGNIDLIYKCSICSKIYWNGTHVKSINLLIEKINKSLKITD